MSDFYATVFGAGIAGTAISAALLERGKSVLMIDPYVSENAPGAPAALVNPATGRHARLSWKSEECMSALGRRIEIITAGSGEEHLISDTGVLRPAINAPLAENFRESLEKYEWPAGWIRWISREETKEINPHVAPNEGALWLDCGFTVFVDRYLNSYRRRLREQGAECRYEAAGYEPEGESGFRIRFKNGESASAEHVIVAAGHHTPLFDDWSYLPLHRVKGQIVCFEADADLNWEHAVSAMGYSLRRGKRTLIVGSTYEHKFEDIEITEKAYYQIEGKLKKMLPGISGSVTKNGQLAGVRVTTPNKLPVIGRHKEITNLCIYTAMGSKGLLFSEYVAQKLAAYLTDGIAPEEELLTDRFH
jgi:glycine/D-amino acid oxidase-like deaminating enzyme